MYNRHIYTTVADKSNKHFHHFRATSPKPFDKHDK